MDDEGIEIVLGVYSAASLPSVISTFIALKKKKQWIGRLRVLAAAPYLIHGIVSIHLFHGIRQDPELAYATNLLVSVGIKACVVSLYPKSSRQNTLLMIRVLGYSITVVELHCGLGRPLTVIQGPQLQSVENGKEVQRLLLPVDRRCRHFRLVDFLGRHSVPVSAANLPRLLGLSEREKHPAFLPY